MSTYKRPTCFTGVKPVASAPVYAAPRGTPGRVESLILAMRIGDASIKRPRVAPWCPPAEYKFIASTLPVSEQDAYLKKCEAWFAANPPRAVRAAADKPNLALEHVIAMYGARQDTLPPIATRVAAYKKAGYSESYLEYAVKRDIMLAETAEERQIALDLIFAKWPAARKPDPKPKGKVIKAVKKKITV